MDDIRPYLSQFDPWHYTTIPFSPNGYLANFSTPEVNCVWSIRESLKSFTTRSFNTWGAVVSLRFLSHLIGDIHEPMHVSCPTK